MAKVYGVHEIELRPGVDPKEFERFFAEKVLPASRSVMKGVDTMLLIGNRGERNGQYMILFEFPDLATRDHYAPDDGPGEADAEFAKHDAVWDEFMKLATMPGGDSVFTDYLVLC